MEDDAASAGKAPEKGAQTLYTLCLAAAVDCMNPRSITKKDFRMLPDHVLFDFYIKMYEDKRLCLLSVELSDLEIFARMLRVKHKRTELLRCYQALLDHGSRINEELIDNYTKLCSSSEDASPQTVDLGSAIATFLNEATWYKQAHIFFNLVEAQCRKHLKDGKWLRRLLDCYHRRIYVETSFCMFQAAETTFNLANQTVEDLKELKMLPNLASLYSNFSNLYGMRSEYDEAFKWCIKSMELLNDDLPPRTIVQILRQASRTCVLKRRFAQAGLLIEQAVLIAERLYKLDNHPSFADTLVDYGFYLLNYDSIEQSVKMYQRALDIREQVFGDKNMCVAVACEDLGYALYVNEYSSGKFDLAISYAERAIMIMEQLLPKHHLALASTKRIQALILEEIAVDMRQPWSQFRQEEYLNKSEELHRTALELSLKVFGERNVQTAKHYGNLGRLYQSMKQYEKAEQMHLQAIAIKEEILGKDDYEVGLSIGHLASLYTFHMKKYKDAENLYLRSINISIKLFGETYSGLEYDYRGLSTIYSELRDSTRLMQYSEVIRDWNLGRQSLKQKEPLLQSIPVNDIVKKFMELC